MHQAIEDGPAHLPGDRRRVARRVLSLLLLAPVTIAATAQPHLAPHGSLGIGASLPLAVTSVLSVSGKAVTVGEQPIAAYGTWSRLSDRERDLVRQAHADLIAPGDDPAYPLAGVGTVLNLVSGLHDWPDEDVPLEFVVTAIGSVDRVLLPDRFARLRDVVQDLFINAGFRAARCGGRACDGRFRITIAR